MNSATKRAALWGVIAEFRSAEQLVSAARAAHEAAYSVEAYAPFHIEELAEAIGDRPRGIAAITFIGAVLGGLGGYAMEWYSAVIDRPLDVGGRPLHSWPMFVPVAFELTILGGALAAVLAFLLSSGLPRLRHPIFGAEDFELASRNRFFLVLRGADAGFAVEAARWLGQFEPLQCRQVMA